MLQPGDEIDIWVVEKALGQGGMGSVYRCHNRNASRILAAVKVLDPQLNRIANVQARFVREAEILFQLEHPNIVKVRNLRMDGQLPYIEMEFVAGKSLEDLVLEGPMAPDKALSLFRQAADALRYMHGLGVRHRDIKPSNLLVEENGRLKLVDFGIATEQDGKTLTESGQTFGSVSYAPPEWIEPSRLDPVRWDIYSLGVTFYEVLTGQFAFPISGIGTSRQKALQVIVAKQNHAPLDPGPTFPVDLRALIRDMTRADVDQRTADADRVLARLATVDLTHIDPNAVFDDPKAGERPSPTWYPGAVEEPQTTEAPAALKSPAKPFLPPKKREEAPTTPPPPPEAPEPPATSKGPLLVVGALVLVALMGGAAWYTTRPPEAPPPPATRMVEVVVAGVDATTALELRLGGKPATSQQGLVYRFAEVPIGAATVEAVVGTDCGTPPAAWCGAYSKDLQVEAGDGAFTVPLSVDGPKPRTLEISAPNLKSGKVKVGELSADLKGGAASLQLPPGKYTVEVESGKERWTQELSVPWTGEGPVKVDCPLVPGAAPAGSPGKPVVVEAAPETGSASPITNGQLSRWLEKHPEWQKEAATAAGKADSTYLKGWDGATPPAGKEGAAAVNVSWAMAQAFCGGRGGLASLDAEPLSWTEGSAQPWHEYRQAGGKPAWRRSDGSSSTKVQPSESGAYVGFRCAK